MKANSTVTINQGSLSVHMHATHMLHSVTKFSPCFSLLSPVSPDEHSASSLYFALVPGLSMSLQWGSICSLPLLVSLNQVKLPIHTTAASESSPTQKPCLGLLLACESVTWLGGGTSQVMLKPPPPAGGKLHGAFWTNAATSSQLSSPVDAILPAPAGFMNTEQGCFSGGAPPLH